MPPNSGTDVDKLLEFVHLLHEGGGFLPGDAGCIDAGAQLVDMGFDGGQGGIGAGGFNGVDDIGNIDRGMLHIA